MTAALAALVRSHLDRLTIGSAQVRPLLAQHLVTGDIGGAIRLGASVEALKESYAGGFAVLLYVLAGVTCASAVLVFVTLRRVDAHEVSA